LSQNNSTLIIGLGGAGGNMVQHYSEKSTHKDYLLINTDLAGFEDKTGLRQLLVEIGNEDVMNILRRGTMLRDIDQNYKDRILEITKEYKTVILLAGLGGITGGTLLIHLVRWLTVLNIKCYILVTTPLHFEGSKVLASSNEIVLDLFDVGIYENCRVIGLDTIAEVIKGLDEAPSVRTFFQIANCLFDDQIDFILENGSLKQIHSLDDDETLFTTI
jgi:hypothetical protein